jgi:importin subunit alpha-6/7
MDNKIIQVALDGLENILCVGEADRGDPPQPGSLNKYALFIEEATGMEKIHECQQNANQEIYQKAYHIIDTYRSLDFHF